MILSLFRTRRFAPLFVVQATGALNDNLFKNALVLLLVFRTGEGGAGLAAVAGGLFIAPFALFSAVAGELADRMDKAALIRVNKGFEVVLMALGAWALMAGGAVGLLAVLFGLGIQAAAFGPLKYGILPQHLAASELLAGNALIEAATFAAILLGLILGGLLVGGVDGPAWVGALGALLSVLGFCASLWIPRAPGSGAVAGRLEPVGAMFRVLRAARANRAAWRAMLGLSWFWAMGATYLAVLPPLVRDVFHGDTAVVTLLLAAFVLGVGVGAMLGAHLGRRIDPARLVGPAGLALSLCTMAFALLCAMPGAQAWGSPAAMLGQPSGIAAWLALFGAAVAGGVFSLPLNTAIQQAAAIAERSRMVAANNVLNAVFMMVGAGVLAGLATLGAGPVALLMGAGLVNLVAAWRFWPAARPMPG